MNDRLPALMSTELFEDARERDVLRRLEMALDILAYLIVGAAALIVGCKVAMWAFEKALGA